MILYKVIANVSANDLSTKAPDPSQVVIPLPIFDESLPRRLDNETTTESSNTTSGESESSDSETSGLESTDNADTSNVDESNADAVTSTDNVTVEDVNSTDNSTGVVSELDEGWFEEDEGWFEVFDAQTIASEMASEADMLPFTREMQRQKDQAKNKCACSIMDIADAMSLKDGICSEWFESQAKVVAFITFASFIVVCSAAAKIRGFAFFRNFLQGFLYLIYFKRFYYSFYFFH